MFKILPSDAILTAINGYTSRHYDTVEWWMAYEWFCRRLIEWKANTKTNTSYELLNATSSVGNYGFDSIYDNKTPCERLAYLFKHGWFWSQANPFLSSLNINQWSDLANPISIKGWRPKNFPDSDWFKMRGRIFKESPNECHPQAVFVSAFSLKFESYNKRWCAYIHYGYEHDSGWVKRLEQNYRESLDSFAARINEWIERKLKPDLKPSERQWREQNWNRIYLAIREVFYGSICRADVIDHEKKIADLMVQIQGDAQIEMTPARLATILRWIRSK